jgi:hypothetical protein
MQVTIDIDLNNENQFDIWMSDSYGSSGIGIQGKTIEDTMKELSRHLEYYLHNIYFKVDGVNVISRSDFESLSMPLDTTNVSNETMQNIANELYHTLATNFGAENTKKYFNQEDIDEENVWDDIDEQYWHLMEVFAVDNGITYYEE